MSGAEVTYYTLIPVEAEEDAALFKDLPDYEILAIFPRLQRAECEGVAESWHWMGIVSE